jgi:hypothetical protein
MDELSDLQICALLLDGDERIDNENEMYHGLRDVAVHAAQARASKPRKQGRGKLNPKAAIGPNPMELCALMVSLIWHEECRKWLGKDNPRAHQNCEALWKAADGPPRSAWGKPGSLIVWRNHLNATRRYRPPHPAGRLIQRILSMDSCTPPSATPEHRAPNRSPGRRRVVGKKTK